MIWSRVKKFLFINANPRQTVLKNVFWLGLSNFGGRLIRASLIIYAARVLGTEGYGVFSYALGIAGFFSVFSDIGISGILTREVARHPQVAKEYISTSLIMKMVLICLSVLIIIFVAPHFTKIQAAIPLLYFAALLLAFDGLRDFS